MKNIASIGTMTMAMGRVCNPPPPPRKFQFQNPPSCFSTMVCRFIEPESRMTVIRMKPMETS